MGAARRLYLHIVSLVSLLALTGGAGSLLQLVFQRIEDAIRGATIMGGDFTSGQAALSVAMILVGGPVYGFHWWMVRRGMRAQGVDGEQDRASAVRAGYLAVVMGVSLAAGVWALSSLVGAILMSLAGVAEEHPLATALAVAVVATPTWAAVARSRGPEIRATRMLGAAAWLTRLYRYLAAYGLLVLLLGGAAGLLETVLSVLIGRQDFGFNAEWWRVLAAGQVASIVVGGGALLVHWREARVTIRDAAIIGEDDRQTRLRAAFFGGALLTTLTWTALGVVGAIADAGRLLFGMTRGGLDAWLETVVGPPVALVPVAAAAWWVATAVRREATPLGPDRVLAARRLTLLLPSLVGLAFLAAGVTRLIETALLRLGGSDLTTILYGQNVDHQVPWYLAQVVVGAVLWLPAWLAVLDGRRREPAVERTALASRAYLFLVVGAAIVAAVPATIVVLYRILEPVLGGASTGTVVEDLAFPIAALIAAAAGAAYHVPLLLGDLAAKGIRPIGVPGTAITPAAEGDRAPAASHSATVELVLEVPEAESAPAIVAGLQSHLPPGVKLNLRAMG